MWTSRTRKQYARDQLTYASNLTAESGPIKRKASYCCRGAGWSNAPLRGSAATGASRASSRLRPKQR
jgi:hypothetical protein